MKSTSTKGSTGSIGRLLFYIAHCTSSCKIAVGRERAVLHGHDNGSKVFTRLDERETSAGEFIVRLAIHHTADGVA
eukprot:scaffold71297_cov32-Tisochrysis_lutea.AAC.2